MEGRGDQLTHCACPVPDPDPDPDPNQALELAAEIPFDVVVMDEIFSPEPGALRGSAAIARLRGLSDSDGGGGRRRRPVLIHCTGQTDASGDGGTCWLGRAAGADALWGKPMPSFTDGSMQRIVADLLSSSAACNSYELVSVSAPP